MRKQIPWFLCILLAVALVAAVAIFLALYPARSSHKSAGSSVPSLGDSYLNELSFLDWAAFGDTRGYVEPCGCNPETDLGGLVRLRSWLLDDHKADGRPVFCLGNMYPLEAAKPQNLGKVGFVESFLTLSQAKGSSVLPCLVGSVEWKQRNVLGAKLKGFLLSNAEGDAFAGLKTVKLKNAIVFGFLSDPLLAAADQSLMQRWGLRYDKELNQGSGFKKILLFSGTDKELGFFESTGWFDLIVSSNTTELDSEPDKKEKEKPGLLLRSDNTYMVPSFAQGVLQSILSAEIPADAAAVELGFGDSVSSKKESQSMVFSGLRSPVLWLGKDDVAELATNDPVSKQYTAYNSAQGDIFDLWIASRQGGQSAYAGAEACKGCHSRAYKVWSESKHAHAFATLKNKDKHRDLECVSCHVVGFDSPQGFPAVPKKEWESSHLKNVQCENCHGPRADHIKNPTKKMNSPDAKGVCVSCHHPPHTTEFDFDARWEMIKHGKDM